jgi:endonuclease-3
MDDGSTGGTYTLLLDLPEAVDVAVGALGTHRFPAGAYAYTGSALGSGGFARVDRHRRVAAGDRDVRHWHIDYLAGHPATALVDAVTSPGVDAECAIACRLPAGPVDGFGASDCDCRSHLAVDDDIEELRTAVEAAHR